MTEPALVEPDARHSLGRGLARPLDDAMYWNIADIQFNCRIGRSTAWRLVRRHGFPAPLVLSQREVLWPREEVVAFLEAQRDPDHYRSESQRTDTPSSAPYVVRAIRRVR